MAGTPYVGTATYISGQHVQCVIAAQITFCYIEHTVMHTILIHTCTCTCVTIDAVAIICSICNNDMVATEASSNLLI